MTRKRDLMCEDILGCDHTPTIPISDHGFVIEWRCMCGRIVPVFDALVTRAFRGRAWLHFQGFRKRADVGECRCKAGIFPFMCLHDLGWLAFRLIVTEEKLDP